MLTGQHRDDTVGLTQFLGSEHDTFVSVQAHALILPHSPRWSRRQPIYLTATIGELRSQTFRRERTMNARMMSVMPSNLAQIPAKTRSIQAFWLNVGALVQNASNTMRIPAIRPIHQNSFAALVAKASIETDY